MQTTIDIAEVARRSGQPASTLRYYEARGLIVSAGRKGLRRTFHPSVLERLALIALGRAGGFSLEEIAGMFAAGDGMDIDREKLIEKADDLDEQIRRLKAIRDGLRHTAACGAPSHLQCPTFRRILAAAGRGLLPPLDARLKQEPRRGRRPGDGKPRSDRTGKAMR